MNEVVERVARVIYEHHAGTPIRTWSRVRGRERQAFLSTATAVIQAMQPASAAMIEAAKASGAGGEDTEIAADFAAMLNAAIDVSAPTLR